MTKDDEVSLTMVFGVLLTMAGVGLLAWGWLYSATVSSGTDLYGLDSDQIYNIGLVTTKLSLLITGAAAFAGGLAMLAARSVIATLRRQRPSIETVGGDPG